MVCLKLSSFLFVLNASDEAITKLLFKYATLELSLYASARKTRREKNARHFLGTPISQTKNICFEFWICLKLKFRIYVGRSNINRPFYFYRLLAQILQIQKYVLSRLRVIVQ